MSKKQISNMLFYEKPNSKKIKKNNEKLKNVYYDDDYVISMFFLSNVIKKNDRY
jgi:hypothetical protein